MNIDYKQIKTIKAQVEYILKTRPETRNSDAELTEIVTNFFEHPDKLKIAETCRRTRQWFNQHRQYLPTNEKVAKQRKINIDEWRVALGYPTQFGSFIPPSEDRSNSVEIKQEKLI